MNKHHISSIKLGILVITSTILLIVSLYFIGNNKNMFGSTITLQTTFDNINGLQKGNNVRYAGINVGTVEEIEIKNDTTILVTMLIDASLTSVVRNSAIAMIGTDGLMGNKLINIDPGNTDGSYIEDNDIIKSLKTVNTEEMLRTLEFTNQNVALVSSNLKNITESIDKSRGTLYTVLMDTTLALSIKQTIGNISVVSHRLNEITTNLAEVSDDLNNEKGVFAAIVKDTNIANDLTNTIRSLKITSGIINNAAYELDYTLQQVNHGQGSINTLLTDSVAAANLREGIINFNQSTIKLNEDLEALKQSALLRKYFKEQDKNKTTSPTKNND